MPKNDDDTYPSDTSEEEPPKSPFKSPLKQIHVESDLMRTHFKATLDFIVLPVKEVARTLD